ncbi:hypothetical protein HYT54_01415, partial [Candidatus Woesearchaeota archaeon]|nr:hypothetical protein [Candidatus Woesearchaeota archaeon]
EGESDVVSAAEPKKQEEREKLLQGVPKERDFNLELMLIIAAFLLISIEIFYIKIRGDI